MNIEEAMMPIDEWNKQFSCKRMQQPISFLTEEDLNKLEQHCEKTIKYGNGRILEEHQITLELIIRYRELKQELEKEKEKNKELSNSYDKLAKECNEENRRCMLLAVENQDLKEKNKKIDEFCRKELAFERRLKREDREPDEFNQGRFYVSENIRKIIEEE